MKEKSLNVNQICAFLLAVIPLTKLITAPAVFAGYCNEQLWQPLVILALFDILLIFIFVFTIKKHNNRTFFDILSDSYSPNFAKTVFFIYAIFFICKSIIPLIEQKELIENAFYETLPQVPAFFPLFLVIFYICLRGLKTFGRLSQACLFISLSGILLILFLSFSTAEFKYILPLHKLPTKSVAICSLNALSWFNDAIYLFFFMGHFEQEKKQNLKIFLSYVSAFFILLVYFIIFYCIFTFIAPTQKIALNSMSIFGVTLVNVGRFDYIALFLLSMSSIVAVSTPLVLATHCFKKVFESENNLIFAIISSVIPFIITLFFASKYESVLSFCTQYLTPLYLICGYVLPFFALGGKKRDLQTR